jgi:hypothetical protein
MNEENKTQQEQVSTTVESVDDNSGSKYFDIITFDMITTSFKMLNNKPLFFALFLVGIFSVVPILSIFSMVFILGITIVLTRVIDNSSNLDDFMTRVKELKFKDFFYSQALKSSFFIHLSLLLQFFFVGLITAVIVNFTIGFGESSKVPDIGLAIFPIFLLFLYIFYGLTLYFAYAIRLENKIMSTITYIFTIFTPTFFKRAFTWQNIKTIFYTVLVMFIALIPFLVVALLAQYLLASISPMLGVVVSLLINIFVTMVSCIVYIFLYYKLYHNTPLLQEYKELEDKI